MRGNRIAVAVVFGLLGVVFAGVGSDLAGWWSVPGQDFTCGTPDCTSEESLGQAFAGLGAALLVLVALLNVRWAVQRGRTRRLRESGLRVPAVLVEVRRVGGNSGRNSSAHNNLTWAAQLPDGSTIRFVVPSASSLPDGTWLEAATDGEHSALMLDIRNLRLARDHDAIRASTAAAVALRQA